MVECPVGSGNSANQFLALNTVASNELAELHAVMQDLLFVESLCKKGLLIIAAPPPLDLVLLTACSDAAIVRYARCFHSGARLKLDPDVLASVEGAVETHHYFFGLRDKHVSHAVNSYEDWQMGLTLKQVDGGRLAWDTATAFHFAQRATDEHGFRMLGRLASEFRNALQPKIDAARERLRTEIDAMTDEQLQQLKPIQFVAPEPDHVSLTKTKSKRGFKR